MATPAEKSNRLFHGRGTGRSWFGFFFYYWFPFGGFPGEVQRLPG